MQYAIYVVGIFQVSIIQQFCRSTYMMSHPLIVNLNLNVNPFVMYIPFKTYVKINKQDFMRYNLSKFCWSNYNSVSENMIVL